MANSKLAPEVTEARKALSKALAEFVKYIKVVNQYHETDKVYQLNCLLPTVNLENIENLSKELDPDTASSTLFDDKFFEYVKNDFGNIGPDKGTIEFKALAKFLETTPKNSSEEKEEFNPIVLFTWPPENPGEAVSQSGVDLLSTDWGVDVLAELAAFSFEYDFVTDPSCYKFSLKNLKVRLDLKYRDSQSKILQSIWKTPKLTMTIELRIPKNLSLKLPDINFNFYGLKFSLNPNLDWTIPNFSPIRLHLPDFIKWPGGSINFFDLFSLQIGLISPNWAKIPWPNINWNKLKGFLLKMLKFFGYNPKSNWNLEINYFTKYEESPSWAAIYIDLTPLTGILGGHKPCKLFLLLGVDADSQAAKAGFLTCTGPIATFGNKSALLQATMQYNFELPENNVSELKAHPGGSLEIITGLEAIDLSMAMGCQCLEFLDEPSVSLGPFSLTVDRLGIQWDKDEAAYVCYADGKFVISELLKGKDGGDLKLPFKGFGFTTDGKLVLKKSWVTLKEAQQVRLDGIKAVQLFLKSYGYAREGNNPFWIGFSGDLRLPVLNVSAGVDRLIFPAGGTPELSGVNIDTDIVPRLLSLKGTVKWNEALNPPDVESSSSDETNPTDEQSASKTTGFGGMLNLGLNIPHYALRLILGFTYVRRELNNSEIIAWSFTGECSLPSPIVIGCGFGIDSLGLMLGQNYLPLPKKNNIPHNQWLNTGLNGNVENILDVINYWTVEETDFAAGFSVGIRTIMDDGLILKSKAILVLVIPGPLVVIAGKADVLRKSNDVLGMFQLLIIYDNDDPGILTSLSFNYDVKNLVTLSGMAEIYFDFEEANRWHFFMGTPEKPLQAKALCIFSASAYLTIDAYKLAVGVNVFYGFSCDVAFFTVKAYITFWGELELSWNPAYVRMALGLKGELAAKIFGFGLGVAISADITVGAPDPWFLDANAEAKFSINLLFFSWSWTGHVQFSWGEEDECKPVILPDISSKDKLFKAQTCSLRERASLIPDQISSNAANSNPNSNEERFLPMDGIIGMEFNRDIKILDPPKSGLLVGDEYKVAVKDEESKYAGKSFHGCLKEFSVAWKENDTQPFQEYPDPIFFSWFPNDENDRKRLVTRDFDQGFSIFNLNDDPTAFVKLTCPSLFEMKTPIEFGTDPDLGGDFALNGLLRFFSNNNIQVGPSNDPTGPESYCLDFQMFNAYLSTNGVIPLIPAGQERKIAVEPDMSLTLDLPSTLILLKYEPKETPPQGTTLKITDILTLYDEKGKDITENCRNIIFKTSLCSGDQVFLLLNDFESSAPPTQQRVYSHQHPPLGVKRIDFKIPGFIWNLSDPNIFFSLFPLVALQEIYKRNLERVRQEALLEYTFQQSKDPSPFLWKVGQYQTKGKTFWNVDSASEVKEEEEKSFTESFTVIPPFEQKTITVNNEEVEVQPFSPYLRRLTPNDGERPVYRDQLPSITYRCNYINAMLQEGKRRLAMLLFDSNGKPCRYLKKIVKTVDLSAFKKEDLLKITRNFAFTQSQSLEEVVEKMDAANIPRKQSNLIKVALKNQLSTGQKNQPKTGESSKAESTTQEIQMLRISSGSLLEESRRLSNEELQKAKGEPFSQTPSLETILTPFFIKDEDEFIIIVVNELPQLFVVTYEEGDIVEYRYMNDDLALDVSKLEILDCVGKCKELDLNGYERGYFRAMPSNEGFWNGLDPNKSYTAKIYCLEEDDEIKDKLPAEPVLHRFCFTSSVYHHIKDLSSTFESPKIREVIIDKPIFEKILSLLGNELCHESFENPADPAEPKIDFGLDIFRLLKQAAPISKGDEPILRDMEEDYLELWESSVESIEKSRKGEGLIFEEIFEEMNLSPDPPSQGKTTVTWIKTREEANQPYETVGLLIDFPEPLEWKRTGLRIKEFKVKLTGETEETNIQDLDESNSDLEFELFWVRSLDGKRLLIFPKITKTQIFNPHILEVLNIGSKEPKSMELKLNHFEDTLEKKDGVDQTLKTSTDLATSKQPKNLTGSPLVKISGPSKNYLGDFTIPASSETLSTEELEKIKENFGEISIKAFSTYRVNKIELEFYYLTENYEDGDLDNCFNFRPIPRIKFLEEPITKWNGALDQTLSLSERRPRRH